MKHKSNPWVALVAIILMSIIMLCACTGGETAAETPEPAGSPRFTIERELYEGFQHGSLVIITDTETGIQYLAYRYGDGVGLTKLEE